jgi:hypothetical protein
MLKRLMKLLEVTMFDLRELVLEDGRLIAPWQRIHCTDCFSPVPANAARENLEVVLELWRHILATCALLTPPDSPRLHPADAPAKEESIFKCRTLHIKEDLYESL